jgi:D-3-phosphoglycerate dehydrogenase
VQYAPITDAVLRALPQLRIISRYGVGVDTVELEAARRRGVWVTNVPDFGIEEVASHAMAMALGLLRHLPMYDREIRASRWSFLSTGPLRLLKSTTFGVMGVGRIGRVVVERAKPWFGRVVACDPYIPQTQWPDGVEQVSYDELFAQSHLLSLHMPLSNETRAIVNRAGLARMPESSYLINTARGGLVDLGALLWALGEGPLAAAALDVLPEEPPAPDSPLLRHPRVLLTPRTRHSTPRSRSWSCGARRR